MKKNNDSLKTYNVSDLLNPHFQNIEMETKKNGSVKGQFVEFKVEENNRGYKIYPSEKLCFLPLKNKEEYWSSLKANKGVFNELPDYIMEVGLDEIKKITIKPALIV